MFRNSSWVVLAALLTAGAVPLALLPQPVAAAESATAISGKVNVNTATAEELQRLPGVGEVRAQAIVSARKKRGGFQSLDQLVEVKGIGSALLEKLRPHLSLSGKTTARAE